MCRLAQTEGGSAIQDGDKASLPKVMRNKMSGDGVDVDESGRWEDEVPDLGAELIGEEREVVERDGVGHFGGLMGLIEGVKRR